MTQVEVFGDKVGFIWSIADLLRGDHRPHELRAGDPAADGAAAPRLRGGGEGVSATRVRYQDVVPSDVPRSLSALRCPTTGVVEVPHSVHWGPDRHADLDDPDDLVGAYQAVVREGSATQQESLLDEVLLRRSWPELILPDRCRLLWETTFPELA